MNAKLTEILFVLIVIATVLVLGGCGQPSAEELVEEGEKALAKCEEDHGETCQIVALPFTIVERLEEDHTCLLEEQW